MNISIATFISGNETFSKEFLELLEYLSKESYCVNAYVFSENYNSEIPDNIMQICMPQTTKYLRIMKLVQESTYDSILFVDNDITINKEAISRFISEYNKNDYALGWGRIGVSENRGLVPSLIEIDKILSHNIIRPVLWKMGIGISLPGQIFILNKKYFVGRMTFKDTVFDDLALGVILKKYNYPYLMSKECLGTEMPKINMHDLGKQRKRWAQGFAETLFNTRKTREIKYVLIHGFAYHFLWIPVWLGVLGLLLKKMYKLASGLLLLLSSVLAWGDIRRIPKALLYICIFPYVHLKWLIAFLRSINGHLGSGTRNSISDEE